MNMKQRKHIASIVGICWVLSILWWCTQETKITETPTKEIYEPDIQQEITTIDDEVTVQDQQLVINPGCMGCGRCMQIAPSNFTMGGRHAQIISQDNLNSAVVQQAVANCPVQVIEIVKV